MVHPPGSPRTVHMDRHGTAEHMCGGHTPDFFRMHSRRIDGRLFQEAIESTGRAYVALCHRSTLLRLWQHRAGTALDDIYWLGSRAACQHLYVRGTSCFTSWQPGHRQCPGMSRILASWCKAFCSLICVTLLSAQVRTQDRCRTA